ncbi:MAG: hypothetical protein E7574_01355 [Ruminococcaceae bacterium]|nr:hypothetical protein [Oscillospiraceae bacterium]
MNTPNSNYPAIIAFIVIIVFLFLFAVFTRWYLNEFLPELRYLNKEIRRTEGKEKSKWKRRRKKLFLSLIPFVRY